MAHLKSLKEIEIMKKGGEILTNVLQTTLKEVKPGRKLSSLDNLAQQLILSFGATPSFIEVKGYKWTICSCVNDVVVHGIPSDYILKTGDVVGIDCGVYYQGFHTDSAWTKLVKEEGDSQDVITEKFLAVGESALKKAIRQVKPGNYIWDISKAIQHTIESAGYSVVRPLVGHGIGRQLHEEPEIPCFVRGKKTATPKIIPGMVLAIEVIYNMGTPDVVYKGTDEWTIVSKDGKISGLFEATVVAIPHGCLVLTPLSGV